MAVVFIMPSFSIAMAFKCAGAAQRTPHQIGLIVLKGSGKESGLRSVPTRKLRPPKNSYGPDSLMGASRNGERKSAANGRGPIKFIPACQLW